MPLFQGRQLFRRPRDTGEPPLLLAEPISQDVIVAAQTLLLANQSGKLSRVRPLRRPRPVSDPPDGREQHDTAHESAPDPPGNFPGPAHN
jgi:hypothetical protein